MRRDKGTSNKLYGWGLLLSALGGAGLADRKSVV